ncbi:hypothetical protein D3C75_964650 [compost metagenome]
MPELLHITLHQPLQGMGRGHNGPDQRVRAFQVEGQRRPHGLIDFLHPVFHTGLELLEILKRIGLRDLPLLKLGQHDETSA